MQIATVGLGSILIGDDGVGQYRLQVLEGTYEFPGNVPLDWRIRPKERQERPVDVWWSRSGA